MSKTKAEGSAIRLNSAAGIRCGSWTSRKCRYARKGRSPSRECLPMNSVAASDSSKAEARFFSKCSWNPWSIRYFRPARPLAMKAAVV